MEISSTPDSAFRILTQNATVFVNRDVNSEVSDTNAVLLSTQFMPTGNNWDTPNQSGVISEPGEYEIGSVYIIGIASAIVPLADQATVPSSIEMIYAIDSNTARLCIIGQMAVLPDRKTIEQISSSYSSDCVAVDLARVGVELAALAGFIRGLETKQLIVRANSDDANLAILAKELGVDNFQSLNTFTIKPRSSQSSQEKLSIIALSTR